MRLHSTVLFVILEIVCVLLLVIIRLLGAFRTVYNNLFGKKLKILFWHLEFFLLYAAAKHNR